MITCWIGCCPHNVTCISTRIHIHEPQTSNFLLFLTGENSYSCTIWVIDHASPSWLVGFLTLKCPYMMLSRSKQVAKNLLLSMVDPSHLPWVFRSKTDCHTWDGVDRTGTGVWQHFRRAGFSQNKPVKNIYCRCRIKPQILVQSLTAQPLLGSILVTQKTF